MSTRIDGVNVTVLPYINIFDELYIGGKLYDPGASTPLLTKDPYTQLTALSVSRCFFQGVEFFGEGADIPVNFIGTKLKNVNVTQKLAIGGQAQDDPLVVGEKYYDPTESSGDTVLSNENKTMNCGSPAPGGFAGGTKTRTDGSGKRYIEFVCTDVSGGFSSDLTVGFNELGFENNAAQNAPRLFGNGAAYAPSSSCGLLKEGGSQQSGTAVSYTDGDVIGIACDFDVAPTVEFFKNGALEETISDTGVWGAVMRVYSNGNGVTAANEITVRTLGSEMDNLPVGYSGWSD